MTYCALLWRTLPLVPMVEVHTVARSALRIIGGREALQDEFPYVVKLDVVPVNISVSKQTQSITVCTASVLTMTWTLTAAHCIEFFDRFSLYHPKKHYIIKHKNRIRTQPNEDLFEILSLYKHPAFRGFIKDELVFIENDIGMLKTEPVLLRKYGKVSAVDFTAVEGQAAIAVGYGFSTIITEFIVKKGQPPLMTLNVLDVIVTQCTKRWHLYPAMCVAHRCGPGATLCMGDSGGPLIHPSGIIAITSVNTPKDCTVGAKERSRTVGTLTAISPYITWITSHVTSGE